MDIKKRIQELSLDQKAKLYFMGLVRQGKIDTLPEDPKAAYVSMMMDKDDYGRSISGKDKSTSIDPEDLMPAARARKLAGMEDDDSMFESLKEIATELGYLEEIGMFHDPLGYKKSEPETSVFTKKYVGKDAYDILKNGKKLMTFFGSEGEANAYINKRNKELNENQPTVFDDESMDELLDIISKYVEDPDDAQAELDRFDQGGFDALSNMVAANLDRDPEYKAWYNKLHSINESKVDISYTDPGFRFYKMKVDGKRLDREEGTKYLKGLGIDMEIPRSYDESILDKIVAQLKEKGIDADHDAAMDVS